MRGPSQTDFMGWCPCGPTQVRDQSQQRLSENVPEYVDSGDGRTWRGVKPHLTSQGAAP